MAMFSPAMFFEEQNLMNQHSSAPNSSLATSSIPPKKKRNPPGTPNPDAEVIALSPKTLVATSRFVCEVCNKGFQREQNLQLHRRGHNLPWKLKQKPTREVKKKVYLCPEPTCVHHNPSRALGDLTGIKKHFSRKHGEKKWVCVKCSKKYAVQSDWKAHSKVCGSKEYQCDCGTFFSRRDSFITHRDFCKALARENVHLYENDNTDPDRLGLSQEYSQVPPTQDQNNQLLCHDILHLGLTSPGNFDHLLPPLTNSTLFPPQNLSSTLFHTPEFVQPNQVYYDHQNMTFRGLMEFPDHINIMGNQIFPNPVHGHVPSLYSPYFQTNNNVLPSLSATELLQNDIRSISPSGTFHDFLFGDNGNKIHDLIFGTGSAAAERGGDTIFGMNHYMSTGFGNMEGSKLSSHEGTESDRLTRDFLGIGQIVSSSMNVARVGFSEQEHHRQHLNVDSVSAKQFSGGGSGGRYKSD